MSRLLHAAQQALEALEGWDNHGSWVWPVSALEQSKQNTTDSIAALREALAQPEQEPVAWMYTSRLAGNQQYITRFQHDLTTYKADKVWPLYTTPPTAQPEQEPVAKLFGTLPVFDTPPAAPEQEPVAFYHPRNGFYWAKPTSIFAPTVVDVEPLPLYAAAERNNG